MKSDKKGILIYGVNQQAAVLYKMITAEQQADVFAFVADSDYRTEDTYCGLPAVDFEEAVFRYSPDKYQICLSFGYKNMIRNREDKFNVCKRLGYQIYTFVSRNANIYTDKIGEGCNIYPGTTIAPFVEIGKGSFIECGNVIAHHTKIGEFNFSAPGVHICGAVITGKNCFIGGACEIINGCILGDYVFVGAAAKVTGNVQSKGTIMPAKSMNIEKISDDMMQYMFK